MMRWTQYLSRSVSVTTGMRREDEAVGLQDDVVGDVPRRRQILLQQRRRHRQRLARVVEAGLVGRIDGELSRRPDIDAGQVADGVVVLGVAQPAGQHRAGIARVAPGLVFAQRANPLDDRVPLGGRRLPRRVLRGISPASSRCSTSSHSW